MRIYYTEYHVSYIRTCTCYCSSGVNCKIFNIDGSTYFYMHKLHMEISMQSMLFVLSHPIGYSSFNQE